MTSQPGPADNTTYTDLNDAERQWIQDLTQPLIDGEVAGSPKEISDYFAFAKAEWHQMAESQRPDPNQLINAIGAMVGVMLAERANLEWKVGADEHGTDLALCHRDAEIVLWPINAVAKRWMSPDNEDLESFINESVATVKSIAGQA